MPLTTSDEIRIERDWAVDVARNAANCLGNLYNLLRGIDEEETVADAIERRDNTIRVLDCEMRNMEAYRREVLEAINRRLDDRRAEALLTLAARSGHNASPSATPNVEDSHGS